MRPQNSAFHQDACPWTFRPQFGNGYPSSSARALCLEPARWFQAVEIVDGLLRPTEAQLDEVNALGHAIWELASTAPCGATLPRAAMDILNAAAALPLAVPRLNARTGSSEFVAEVRLRAHWRQSRVTRLI